jgi:hypothetical protein
VGSRAGLDTEARGKSFACAGDRTPVVQSVARRTDRPTLAQKAWKDSVYDLLTRFDTCRLVKKARWRRL